MSPEHATLVDTATHEGTALPFGVERGDVVVALPALDPPRELFVWRNDDQEGRLPNEPDYVAVLGYLHSDDSSEAWHEARARARAEARWPLDKILAELFVDHEPQLDAELVTIDGARAVRVDFADHWPHHVLYVPERALP